MKVVNQPLRKKDAMALVTENRYSWRIRSRRERWR